MGQKKKLYVLVRKDLTPSHQAVQACHAVAEWLLHDQSWKNETLIYLGVKNEIDLNRWVNKLCRKRIPYVLFREPDMDGQATALASYSDSKVFKSLELM